MKRLTMIAMVAAWATVIGCDSGNRSASPIAGTGGGSGTPAGGGGQGGAAGGDGRVPLVNWVDDLAVNHNGPTDQPDTVEDKVPIIIDTDDPAAFDPLLQKQPQQ